MAEKLLVATRTFITMVDGKRVKVTKGKTRVAADHVLARAHEGAFKDAGVTAEVEDVTARPGAKRSAPTKRRGTTKKADAPTDAAKDAGVTAEVEDASGD